MIKQQKIPLRDREFLRSVSAYPTDAKHVNMAKEFGYWLEPTTQELILLRQRNPLAFSAIDKTIKMTWQTIPEIVEPKSRDKVDTQFEKEINRFFKRHIKSIIEADTRTLMSNYTALLVVVRDSKKLDQPIKKIDSLESIVELKPIFEHQLTVSKRYEDKNNPEMYGKPLIYQYEEPILDKENQESSSNTIDIHHTRLIILNEFTLGTNINRLTVALDACLDAKKIGGSSAEGYWKNATTRLHFNVLGNQSPLNRMSDDEINDALTDQVASLNEGADSAVITHNAEITPLVANIPMPKEAHDIQASLVAMVFNMPMTILIGQQTGRLASDEDSLQWALSCEERQNNAVNGYIRQIIDFVMYYGAISLVEYEVKWQSLAEPTDSEKLDRAIKMADINIKGLNSLGQAIFSANEIRLAAGYEPIPDGDSYLPVITEGDNEDPESL